jgi:predicted ATP-grasp superfamily ATP-dependent carboligase
MRQTDPSSFLTSCLPHSSSLLILGASARAAAFSALRAGLQPWCADRFGDLDLCARCPTTVLPASRYPHGFLRLLDCAPPAPWIYTGGLENRPALVRRLARLRPLWGNEAPVLEQVRSPLRLAALLRAQGLPCPQVHAEAAEIPAHGRWLIKPWQSAGGTGIRFWPDLPKRRRRFKRLYFQEYIEGEPCAAIYVGDGQAASLLGVTYQLIGESWLHAAPFRYCGSIGPIDPTPPQREALERLGHALAKSCRLRGLFGVDCVLRGDIPWPVEVNPRYTASVEVLEYALGISALPQHAAVFGHFPSAQLPAPRLGTTQWIGKAILFARTSLIFPHEGPWCSHLEAGAAPRAMPDFADIPSPGQQIELGSPILTFFARAGSSAACRDSLRLIAGDLDHWLFTR